MSGQKPDAVISVLPMGKSRQPCNRTGGESKGQCVRMLGHSDLTTVAGLGHAKLDVHVNRKGESWK